MAKPPNKPKVEEIETEPDAWERFEKAVGRMFPRGFAPLDPDEDIGS